jgi:hypothetical protein
MLKIVVGGLATVLLLGVVNPAWSAADQQRAKRPALCPLDYGLPVPAAQVEGRRVLEPAANRLDYVLQFMGIDPAQWRSREVSSARAASAFFLPVSEQTKGKIQGVYLDKHELTLVDNTGVNWKFHVSKNCKVFLNDKEAALTDLRNGDEAIVAHETRGFLPNVAIEIRGTRK